MAIQILHHPDHASNVDRMVKSVQASLDYFTKHFGPYPHRQIRFVERPGDSVSAHASPVNISYQEGFALMNPHADPRGFDFPFAVVAHEVAHQWKPEQELKRLAEKSPQRYQRDEAGRWRCPPGESSAGQIGLYYRLRTSDGINWIWQRNIQFLEDYLRNDRPAMNAAACAMIGALVTDQWGLRLSD